MAAAPRDVQELIKRIRSGDTKACMQVRERSDYDQLLQHGLADACLSHFGFPGERKTLAPDHILHKRAQVTALAKHKKGGSSHQEIRISPEPFIVALVNATSNVRIGRWDACAISQALVPLLNSLSDMDERQFWGDRATWDLVLGRTLSVVRHCILHGQHAAKAVFAKGLGDLVPRLAAFALHHEFSQPELRTLGFEHASTILMECCDVGLGHSADTPNAAGYATLAMVANLPIPQKRSTFAKELLPIAKRCVMDRELGVSVLDHFSYIFCALSAHGGDAAAPITREPAAVASALIEMARAPASKRDVALAVEIVQMMNASVSGPNGSGHEFGVRDQAMGSFVAAVCAIAGTRVPRPWACLAMASTPCLTLRPLIPTVTRVSLSLCRRLSRSTSGWVGGCPEPSLRPPQPATQLQHRAQRDGGHAHLCGRARRDAEAHRPGAPRARTIHGRDDRAPE